MLSYPKFSIMLTILALALAGCSKGPEKVIPKITPEAQAELDKQHAENKAKLESTAPAGATK